MKKTFLIFILMLIIPLKIEAYNLGESAILMEEDTKRVLVSKNMNKKSIKINFRGYDCELIRDRIRPIDTPGKYVYNIRHDDNEQPCTLEQHVQVNYWGTLISDTEIDLLDGSLYDHYSILSQFEIDQLNEIMNKIIFDE